MVILFKLNFFTSCKLSLNVLHVYCDIKAKIAACFVIKAVISQFSVEKSDEYAFQYKCSASEKFDCSFIFISTSSPFTTILFR